MEMLRQQRILIVDNDERVLQVMNGFLANAGFDTRTASDGHSALDLLKLQECDLVFVADHLSDFFLVLLNKGIDVAKCVGNIPQRQPDRADPRVFCHLVRVYRPGGGPADFHSILLSRLLHRSARQIDYPLLQVLQTGLS